jgi:hypothetical protein
MLGDIGGGTAIFPTQGEPLDQPQQHEQDWRGDADRLVARQQPDTEGGEAHKPHRHEKGVLAPNQIADAPEQERAERPHRKPGGEGR